MQRQKHCISSDRIVPDAVCKRNSCWPIAEYNVIKETHPHPEPEKTLPLINTSIIHQPSQNVVLIQVIGNAHFVYMSTSKRFSEEAGRTVFSDIHATSPDYYQRGVLRGKQRVYSVANVFSGSVSTQLR